MENQNSNPVMHIHGTSFKDQNIVLDFHEYKKCVFDNCELIYYGYGPVGLVECEFRQCGWALEGAAKSTLNFMTRLYSNGNGADRLIEATFEKIRNGEYL